MAAVVRKKQDDKYLNALRELITIGNGNRQCFDCGQKGPTYVNMTIGSFVCTRCSGVLRGLTPPHRIKSISMATFTQEEIDFLKSHGNDECAKTWLGLWDPKRAVHQDQRELMVDKYERKRYYLEPASPLKSLTNAASLKTNTQQQQQNGNNNNNLTTGTTTTATTLSNGHHSIHLTPPSVQRNNNSNSNNTKNSAVNGRTTTTTAISRPQHTNQQQQHPNQNGFATQQQQQQQQHHQQFHDAFMFNNSGGLSNGGLHNGHQQHHNGGGIGVGRLNSLNASSNGTLSDTSSCASNGFGPDADFVADFNSAHIFDATITSSSHSPAVSTTSAASSTMSSNGYAKIQPIVNHKQKQQQQQQMLNTLNGNGNPKILNGNGNGTSSNGNTENFADFEHAPIIHNAAGLPIPNGMQGNTSRYTATASSPNNNKLGTTPSEDRYAALKDLDEQLRESKAFAAAAASIVATNVVDTMGTNNNNQQNGNNINPFKSQQAAAAAAAAAAAGGLVNPFQAAAAATTNGNQPQQTYYGQMTVIPNGIVKNGFVTNTQTDSTLQQQQQQQHQAGFYNYSNGFVVGSGMNVAVGNGGMYTATMPVIATNGPNGCGFGFGTMQQQISANGGAYNNPFAAAATGGGLNSNNPFL